MNAYDLLNIIISSVAFVAISSLFSGVIYIFRKRFQRDEEKERTRLRNDVLGWDVSNSPEASTSPAAGKVFDERDSVDYKISTDEHGKSSGREAPTAAAQEAQHQTRFALLLIDYYAYGLTQARRSFSVSLSFSILGGAVLVSGLALAIFRSETRSQVDAAAITSLAGALTSGIGALFHRQAASALKHMEGQTKQLRQDMKAERDTGTALDILKEVVNGDLRSQLQAALILQFSGAELPNLEFRDQMSNISKKTFNGSGDRPAAVPGSAEHANQ